ncbi:MAG TPA: substrate-binding domain-containing protein [Gaiellaceae bacterium]|nr:substrate-binding domain-containing protein [Gaiellaceae bacterium]
MKARIGGTMAIAVMIAAAVALLAVASASGGRSTRSADAPYTLKMPWGTFTLSSSIRADVQKRLKAGRALDIPVFTWIQGDAFFVPVRKGIADAAKQLHTTSQLIGPVGAGQPQEISDIQSYLGRKPDGLAITLSDEKSAKGLIDGLIAKGIPVIIWNTDAPTTHRLAYIGQNNEKAGFKVGQLMVTKLKAKHITSGTIAMFATDATAAYSKLQRFPGFEKAVHAALPNIKFQTPVTLGTDISAAVGKVDSAVRGKSDIVGMYSADEQVVALANWEKQNASAGKYVIVGHNLLPTELSLMSQGYIDGVVGQNPYLQGYWSVQWLKSFVTTGRPFKPGVIIDTGYPVVDTPAAAKTLLSTDCGGKGCG